MRLIINTVRVVIFAALFSVAGASAAYGQDAKLQIDYLDKFNSTASEMIDVTVDERLLQLAAKFLNPKRSPDEAKIKELVEGLKGVFVKRFGFEQEGQFTDADVEAIRSQLRDPSWARVVGVRSRKKTSINIDVYIMSEGAIIKGLAVLAVEPKALTVVNVVGPIDIEKLSQLEGRFGIPRLDLVTGPDAGEKPADDRPADKKPPE